MSTITVNSINIQRFSNNLLLNNNNDDEILFNKNSIQYNRNELTQAIKQFVTLNNSIGAKEDSIAILGNEYLKKNNTFLNLIKAKDSAVAFNFRIQYTRPLLDKLLNYDKLKSAEISSEIISNSAIEYPIFSSVEFWILILGLIPFLLIYFKLMNFIFKIIYWETIF